MQYATTDFDPDIKSALVHVYQDIGGAKTANGGSSMAGFLSCEPKLLTVAVLWPLF